MIASPLEYWKSKKNSNFYFHGKSGNYKIVGLGEGYTRIAGMIKGINALAKAFGSSKVWKKEMLKYIGVK